MSSWIMVRARVSACLRAHVVYVCVCGLEREREDGAGWGARKRVIANLRTQHIPTEFLPPFIGYHL
jgi:hypothetical protein